MSHHPNSAAFPVVGIGCSAGGLEALEKFLAQVAADSGMAYVIVQHLDPTHESRLPEILQRATTLPVQEVAHHLRILPNQVYVIPPNTELSLINGQLCLADPAVPRGSRLPVDHFLQTLAQDRRDQAIGVILSGMGSDGLQGLRAIKEGGGLTLAQEPAEAKAQSMPLSVIDAGLVDIVATAEKLPAQIAPFLRHATHRVDADTEPSPEVRSALERVIALLRARCGHDFSLYKTSTLYRRIERRTALHQLSHIADYVAYLGENPRELDLLFKELLIGVTRFFRDPAVWHYLRDVAFPALFARHPAGRPLRAWVPACSSGEEAYSLAIAFKEAVAAVKPDSRYSLQIYATDLDADAIDRARRGFYPANIAADVAPERLQRYFVAEEDGGYRLGKEIRDMVIFAPQNIISDPPFTRLDVLSCRNLLIYFGARLQKKLLPLFHYALNSQGLLVLGSAETINGFNELFAPLDAKARVFGRIDQRLSSSTLEFPIRNLVESGGDSHSAHHLPKEENLEYQVDQLIQQRFAPAAVLVNGEGDILYISGRTGKYLEPAAGKVNINIHAMAREGLREALIGVIRNALRQPEPIHINGLQVGTGRDAHLVNVTIQGLEQPEVLRGRALVVFEDLPRPTRSRSRKKPGAAPDEALSRELQQVREALRVTHEEMQTSLEEQKSANEELQSTNEELQSTNEELTTSKEELQSLNEELQTVNAELQSRLDELASVRNDMSNLLNSTEIATIFLDNGLLVRRFTAHATHLFKLIPGDIGRPLTDIRSELDNAQIEENAREVLRSLVFHESQVSAKNGHWYRVRIMPYRTLDNVIDGVVITFIDISEIRMLEAELGKRPPPPEPSHGP